MIKAVYLRQLTGNGFWVGEEPIEIAAECWQDSGESFLSEVLIVWTDETLVKLAALSLDAEELVGCTEAMEEAFHANERELCRVSIARNREGRAA